MKAKTIIGLFFLGLLFMVILELSLARILDQLVGLPTINFGWPNAFVGLATIIGGGFLVIWSVRIQYTLGKGTPAPIKATQKLVVSGPYAYTRNPMTLGAASFYLGISIWLGSIATTCLVVLIFVVLLSYIYTHETRELSERFGLDYQVYKCKTPFLIPRLRGIR